ncbi:MAG: DNA primase, partial [Bacteroidetes bacterium]
EGDEGFKPSDIAEVPRFHELYTQFKEAKNAHRRRMEQEQEENLAAKRRIIDEILALTTRAEVKGTTFKEFDALRKQWKEIGFVPQREVDDLYKSYTHAVEQFFDYLNINRELRDLDYKKNFDSKTALCNRAEELIVLPDPVEAFRRLQDLHAQWKEIGPVMREKSDEIWERFSAATARINTRHREHFEALKAKYEENLVRKEALCSEVERLLAKERRALKQWFQDSEKVVAMQQEWRTIGPVPRKHNARIWDRFQELCEKFFTGRREFEKGVRAEGQVNIQKKLDLCVQAEALKDSQDWSATTKELIELQNQWKQVGYTPYKKGSELWARFRAAMDFFFEARNKAQASARDSQRENLKLKQAIIEELRAYQPGEDAQASVEWLKQVQNRWSEIGFVPFKQKDSIQAQYRKEIDRLYDMLRMDRREHSMETFKTRVDGMKGQDDGSLSREKSRLNAKVRALEAEKRQMETNLGFFSSSSSDNPVLSRLQTQLEEMDREIALVREKMKHIDRAAKGGESDKANGSEKGSESDKEGESEE